MKPDKTIKIRKFPGLMTNQDRHDQPPGATRIQVNATSIVAGRLDVRKGMRDVNWEN